MPSDDARRVCSLYFCSSVTKQKLMSGCKLGIALYPTQEEDEEQGWLRYVTLPAGGS
jgi:hypothetical protein